jgi:hypothetical protein
MYSRIAWLSQSGPGVGADERDLAERRVAQRVVALGADAGGADALLLERDALSSRASLTLL